MNLTKTIGMINPNEIGDQEKHKKEKRFVDICYLTRGQLIGEDILFTGNYKQEGRNHEIKKLGIPRYTIKVKPIQLRITLKIRSILRLLRFIVSMRRHLGFRFQSSLQMLSRRIGSRKSRPDRTSFTSILRKTKSYSIRMRTF